MFREILASAAVLALALQPAPIGPIVGLGDDSGVHVVELQSNRSINEDGFAEVEDRYELSMEGKTYVLVSDAWLLDEERALRYFFVHNEVALNRIGEIVGIPTLSDANAEEYATAIIPIVTATEHRGYVISERDRQYARTVLSMCFLLMGDENAQGLRKSLDEIEGLNPTSEEFAQVLEQLSVYAPALGGNNSEFVRDAWDFVIRGNTVSPFSMTPGIDGGSFSLTKANNYAKRWAYSPNPQYVYFRENGDCANFVSQIMKAGGFRENAEWRYNAGRPTRAWSVANDLANRFGVTRKATSLSTFTSRAVVGRPVGAHNGRRVYHVGYVMGKGGYATYRGESYRALTIAQHSGNYYGSMDGGAASGWRDESAWVTP